MRPILGHVFRDCFPTLLPSNCLAILPHQPWVFLALALSDYYILQTASFSTECSRAAILVCFATYSQWKRSSFRDSAAGLADGLPVGHAIEVVPLSLPSLALPCPTVSLAGGQREGGQLVRLEAPCSKYVLRSADNVAKSNLR